MRNIFKKLLMLCMCLVCAMTVFVGCNEETPPGDPNPPTTNPPAQTPVTPPAQTPSTTYVLVFDEDNNPSTTNVEKTIQKTAINDRSTWPALANKNGFSGEWVKKGQSGDTITLIPNYGDGTENDPYLIGSMAQFETFLATTTNMSQIYTDANYFIKDQASAVRRVDQYDTVEIIYYLTGSSWVDAMEAPTNKMYYRLVADLNFATVDTFTRGGTASFGLDGGKYDLDGNLIGRYAFNNLESDKCKYVSGATGSTTESYGKLFNYIVSSDIKNLVLNQKSDPATLAYMIKGETTLENIEVNAVEGFLEYESAANRSSFVNFVSRGADLTMKNCVNNADIRANMDYFGVFVGGYAQYGSTVVFDGCVNNGDIETGGTVGILLGSSNTNPSDIEVINCANNGHIIADNRTHMLVPIVDQSGKGYNKFNETTASIYDNTVAGRFAQNGTFTCISGSATLSLDGNNLVITANEGNLSAGSYEISIHRNFWRVDRTGTRRFYIPVTTVTQDGTHSSVTVENVAYNMIDTNSFIENDGTIPNDVQWHEFDANGNYTWAKDDASKSYLLDVGTDYELVPTDRMIITVVIKDASGNIIESLALRGILVNN